MTALEEVQSQEIDNLEERLKELMDIAEFYVREHAFRSEEDEGKFFRLYEETLQGLSLGIEFTDTERQKLLRFLERCLDIPSLRYFSEMREVLGVLDTARSRVAPTGAYPPRQKPAAPVQESAAEPMKRRSFLDRLLESWFFAFFFGIFVMLVIFKICEYYGLVQFQRALEFLSRFPF